MILFEQRMTSAFSLSLPIPGANDRATQTSQHAIDSDLDLIITPLPKETNPLPFMPTHAMTAEEREQLMIEYAKWAKENSNKFENIVQQTKECDCKATSEYTACEKCIHFWY